MDKYSIIFEALQEMLDNNVITMEDAEIINDLAYDKYVSEGIKENINNVKNKAVDKFSQASENYVKSANKRSEFVAKKLSGKKNTNDVDLVDKYNKKFNKIKTAYKVGEMVVAQAVVLAIPLPGSSTIFTASLIPGYKNSTDPTDQKIATIINGAESGVKNVFGKVKSLFTKFNGKKATPEFDKEIKRLESEGLNIARNADNQIKNLNNNGKLATESTTDFDLLLIECQLFEDPFDAINRFIMEADYGVDTFEKINELIQIV